LRKVADTKALMVSPNVIGGRVGSIASLQVGVMTSLLAIGPLALAMMPVLMIGLTERFHWSEAKSGLLATIELGALAIASTSGLYWQARWNWRWLAIAATLVIVVANLAATRVSGFAGLSCARLVAGAGSGILVALYFAFLPGTRSPDRIGSIATFAQVVTQVGGYYAASWLLPQWGLNGLYVFIAIIATLLLPFVTWIPIGSGPSKDSPVDRRKDSKRTIGNRLPGIAGLLANAFFFAALTGIYTFFGEFGQNVARLSDVQTIHAIALAAALASLGPVASYLISRRFGFLWPILGSAVGLMLVLVLLAHGGYGYFGFLALISLLLILWNFAQPYSWAIMVAVDERLTVAVPGAQFAGIAIGPAIVGVGIQTIGVTGGVWLALGMMIIFLILIAPLCAMSRGAPPASVSLSTRR
jgi:predicted MFS family arabinose efflux permease